jgi:hypothetical protein
MTRSRAAAIAALLLGAFVVAAMAHFVVQSFPHGLIVGALLIGAVAVGWYGLVRTGFRRIAGLVCAAGLLVASAVLVIAAGGVVDEIAITAGAIGVAAASRMAFAVRVPLQPAPDPA